MNQIVVGDATSGQMSLELAINLVEIGILNGKILQNLACSDVYVMSNLRPIKTEDWQRICDDLINLLKYKVAPANLQRSECEIVEYLLEHLSMPHKYNVHI